MCVYPAKHNTWRNHKEQDTHIIKKDREGSHNCILQQLN